MVGRGHDQRVDRLVVQRAAEVLHDHRRFAVLASGELLGPPLGDAQVHVANIGDAAVAAIEKAFAQRAAPAANAHHRQRELVVGRRGPDRSGIGQNG